MILFFGAPVLTPPARPLAPEEGGTSGSSTRVQQPLQLGPTRRWRHLTASTRGVGINRIESMARHVFRPAYGSKSNSLVYSG